MIERLIKALFKIPLGVWLMGFAVGCMFQYFATISYEISNTKMEVNQLKERVINTDQKINALLYDIRKGLGLLDPKTSVKEQDVTKHKRDKRKHKKNGRGDKKNK